MMKLKCHVIGGDSLVGILEEANSRADGPKEVDLSPETLVSVSVVEHPPGGLNRLTAYITYWKDE